eukprot:UN18412
MTLELGNVKMKDLKEICKKLPVVQNLQKFYSKLYPDHILKISNIGFFLSPANNSLGQEWHTDWYPVKVNRQYTEIPPLVTIITALNDLEIEDGPTVFGLGSHHSLLWQSLLFPDGVESVAPLLKRP